MNKTCARCEKTVYPIEELKCLDKIWHKGCFKCQECGMTLNMKTYKGYGKLPYCEAHIPKAKPTTMAVTPELTRIAENTKIQSNVKYHADFEKSKGKYTQVADDPETLRIKATTKIISNVAYHGDLEKKAAMEKQRNINENEEAAENQPSDNYHQQIENYATEMLPPRTQHHPPKEYQQHTNRHQNDNNYHTTSYQQQPSYQSKPQTYANPPQTYANPPQSYANSPQTYAANPPQTYAANPPQSYATQPPSYNHPPQHNTADYQNSNRDYYPSKQYAKGAYDDYSDASRNMIGQERAAYAQSGKIGRIADYDPISDGPRTQPFTQRPAQTLIYNSSEPQRGAQSPYDNHAQQMHQQQQQLLLQKQQQLRLQQQQQQQMAKQNATPLAAKVYVAMYDYEATDTDEVSFREGDLISNVTSIDEGWMTGRVLRTGHTGMLPANYVQLAK